MRTGLFQEYLYFILETLSFYHAIYLLVEFHIFIHIIDNYEYSQLAPAWFNASFTELITSLAICFDTLHSCTLHQVEHINSHAWLLVWYSFLFTLWTSTADLYKMVCTENATSVDINIPVVMIPKSIGKKIQDSMLQGEKGKITSQMSFNVCYLH